MNLLMLRLGHEAAWTITTTTKVNLVRAKERGMPSPLSSHTDAGPTLRNADQAAAPQQTTTAKSLYDPFRKRSRHLISIALTTFETTILG